MRRSTLRRINAILLVLGLGGLAWMVHAIGPGTIADGMAQVGAGFALVCGFHLLAILGDSLTLRASTGHLARTVAYSVFARASLVGHGINQATPLGKVGELTKLTLLAEHMSGERATAALIVQNLVMFVVNCGLIATGTLVVWLAFEVEPRAMIAFAGVAAVFLVLGAGAVLLMWRGLGDAPFRVARWVRVSAARIERWQGRWQEVEGAWRETSANPGAMRLAFGSSIASKLFDFGEAYVILSALGVEPALAAAVASVANYQVVVWVTPFVPLQAGTAEGGAFVLFGLLGLPPQAGVLLELIRKARRLVFIALAIALLGWHTARQVMKQQR
ncbi:MAG TPA: lysylphosphatidylglycerol synthase transmembrane domain-containing protein [Kofleriaceae bacterium]|nr:lysylphosphatidylglycerol synthase transmembrane domain-containing protein [Kofleriaceae bacterium]